MQALHRSLPAQDEDCSRSWVQCSGIGLAVLCTLLVVTYGLDGMPDGRSVLALYLLGCMVGVLTWALVRRGHWRAGAFFLVWSVWALVALMALVAADGFRPGAAAWLLLLVWCGGLLGTRPTWYLLGACVLAALVFQAAALSGALPTPILPSSWTGLCLALGMQLLATMAALKARRYFMARTAMAELAHAQLQVSEYELRKFSLAVAQCPASIVITDTQAHVVYANQAFLQSSGYTLDEVLGRHTREVSTTGMEEALRTKALQQLAHGQVWQGDMRNRLKDGRVVLEDVRVAPLCNEQGEPTHYVELKQDITARTQAEATIHQLSHFDRITGLPNRFAFLKRLMELKEQSRGKRCHVSPCPRHGLLVLDIDRFTSFNDVHGSLQGDQLLRAFAACLGALVPATGVVVRNSADEFAIVLENLAVDIEDAELLIKAFAQRLTEALAVDPLWIEGLHDGVRVTCCIGMSVFPDLQNDSEIEALRRANTALHEAKSRGPGHAVLFQEVMAENASRRYRIEKGLRRAVGEGELRLFLQGQYDAAGRAVGAEALVRWDNPERGLLSPGSFIPVAEESDLIVLLGDWVLEQACRLLARPEAQRNRLLLSVNVSARQFLHADFAPKLKRLLAFTEADPSQLTLEVTEGLVLGDFEEAARKMRQLHKMGIHFALDDFGTGYSSLAYLKRLPIQELKIDQSFVRDVDKGTHSEALVEAILWVAHRFGLRVVAEGVENAAQAQLLRSWEPNILCQGYFHDRPMPWQEWMARYVQQPPLTVE